MKKKLLILCGLVLAPTGFAREAVLTINEVHYHPSLRSDSGEWVELFNQMAIDLDISGWRLEGDNMVYDVPPDTVVPAGTY
ncbi:MAG: lamin tail domain-containing protein, partial [Verrucomicrobiota bacterium]